MNTAISILFLLLLVSGMIHFHEQYKAEELRRQQKLRHE